MGKAAADRRSEERARRRRRARRGERGVALLLVLTSVALLYVLAQQSRDEVEVYSTAAAVSRDQVIAEYQARSVINLSRLLLHSEPTIRRALTPVLAPMMALMGRGLSVPQLPIWEQADLLLGAFRTREGAQSFGQLVGVDIGAAKGLGALTGVEPVVIVDEDSKINVNGLNRGPIITRRVAQQLMGLIANPSLEPFFSSRDPDGQFTDRLTLVGAIIDYGDEDTTAFDVQSLQATVAGASGGGGPEDNFYSSLRPPYLRRNAPFDSVEELRMVRGLGDDDLWAAVVDPDPGTPRRRTLTVWGQGAVNVNGANAQTLLAIACAAAVSAAVPCNDPGAAAEFITRVNLIQAFTQSMGIPLFTTPQSFVDTIQGRGPMGQMLSSLGVQPIPIADPGAMSRSIATESKVFSIYSEATVGQAHVRIHAVVDMRPQPGISSTYLQGALGSGSRSATAGQQVMTTPTGAPATVSTAGGTIVYWREE